MEGRGRGRGRAWGTPTAAPVAKTAGRGAPPQSTSQQSKAKGPGTSGPSVERYLALVKQELGDGSSSDEEDVGQRKRAANDEPSPSADMRSIFEAYTALVGSTDRDHDDAARTRAIIAEANTGMQSCLICLEHVRGNDPTWQCEQCFCACHMVCIQKWIREGPVLGDLSAPAVAEEMQKWFCPKCRNEYSMKQKPVKYFCFCGKVENPSFNPWILPHTCGDKCEKPLKPDCGHRCVLPCHPGPCPPCPQTVRAKCFCGAESSMRRCNRRFYSCGSVCRHALRCGHTCESVCHTGPCPPCPHESVVACRCGKTKERRKCDDADFQCDATCDHMLSCGKHRCGVRCHAPGQCGPCALQGPRRCPCGKTAVELPCDVPTPNCGDTCDKALECGIHRCASRCHAGPCSRCPFVVNKTCRCGARTEKLPCWQEFTCTRKCGNNKSCGRHQCKQKCCTGNCPPCEEQCGRRLKCGNHKCQSTCHAGPCFPCPLSATISCACGDTVVSVPCGREKDAPLPRCRSDCRQTSTCHHPARLRHPCHPGPCPPCAQICENSLPDCSHTCPKTCHDPPPKEELPSPKKTPRAASAVVFPLPKPEQIDPAVYRCPPCVVPVRRACAGWHEVREVACSDAPFHCAAKCGRPVQCGLHTCQLECHVPYAETPPADLPVDPRLGARMCEPCALSCALARFPPCKHRHVAPCHSDECPPCDVEVPRRCHCGKPLTLSCRSIALAKILDEDPQALKKHGIDASAVTGTAQLLSCGSVCHKTLPCGHTCRETCHAGACPAEECTRKAKLTCACGRQKTQVPCNEHRDMVRAGTAVLPCTPECEEAKTRNAAQDEPEESEEEEVKSTITRTFQKRKRKEVVAPAPPPKKSRRGLYAVIALIILIAAVACAYMVAQAAPNVPQKPGK